MDNHRNQRDDTTDCEIENPAHNLPQQLPLENAEYDKSEKPDQEIPDREKLNALVNPRRCLVGL
jgi:hypothetical protein